MRDHEDSFDNPNYIGEESSHGSGLRRSRDRSRETMGRCHEYPHHERLEYHNAVLDAMSWALRKATRLSFYNKIECIEMSRHFC